MKTDREIVENFIIQIKSLAEELLQQGREQEYVDLLFRSGFVVGKALKSLEPKDVDSERG